MRVPFFKSLRGKIALVYTLFSLLALGLLVAILGFFGLALYQSGSLDLGGYYSDAIMVTSNKASRALSEAGGDPAKLQPWLEEYIKTGLASEQPQHSLDAEAAVIIKDADALILNTEREVVAGVCPQKACPLGKIYQAGDGHREELGISSAFFGLNSPMSNYYFPLEDSKYQTIVPVFNFGDREPKAVILLTIEAEPPRSLSRLRPFIPAVVIVFSIIVLFTIIVGSLFGWLASGSFEKRIRQLSQAADAWETGKPDTFPLDKSKDEVGFLTRKLRAMAERTQSALQSQQQLATMEERNRLARELHDTVKQQNFATIMQLRAASKLLETDQNAAMNAIAEAEALLKRSQEELNTLINELRPSQLDGVGLGTALRTLSDGWSRQNKIPVELEIKNEFNIGLDREHSLYRISQEALSNITRHAEASYVKILLSYDPSYVDLVITDDGKGAQIDANSAAGYGIQNMRRRAEEQYGQFYVDSTPGKGTALRVILPLPNKTRK